MHFLEENKMYHFSSKLILESVLCLNWPRLLFSLLMAVIISAILSSGYIPVNLSPGYLFLAFISAGICSYSLVGIVSD